MKVVWIGAIRKDFERLFLWRIVLMESDLLLAVVTMEIFAGSSFDAACGSYSSGAGLV